MAGRSVRPALCALVFLLTCSQWGNGLLDSLPEVALHTLLYKISDHDSSLVRTYLSPAHVKAAAQLHEWMAHAGLGATVDGLGNVRGRAEGAAAQPTLFTGSHYDTVIDGGNFDGSLGIISGIAAAKALLLNAAVSKKLLTAEEVLSLPRDATGMLIVPEPARNVTLLARSLEVVGFADEEGVRFQSTYLGSRALSGGLAASGALDARDASGVSLRELLVQRGVSDVAELAVGRGGALAYVEVHMEQGPVLEAAGARLAAVSGIAGQTRLGLTVRGEQGHAGTVPMPLRRDPVPAAARIVAALERRCGGHAAKDSPTGLVCTVGTFQVWPGASNVIAGSVQLSLDIRSQSDEERQLVVQDISQVVQDTCAERGLNCTIELRHQAPAVHADKAIVRKLAKAIQDSAADVERVVGRDERETAADGACAAEPGAPPPSVGPLVSGAGHDAAEMASVAPMGMIFVRCRGGFSHSPLEHVAPGDVAAGTVALAAFLEGELSADA